LGLFFILKKKTHLPLKLISSNIPTGIKYVEKKGSAQIISAVALAALNSLEKQKLSKKKNLEIILKFF
jgi:hypothetical protein